MEITLGHPEYLIFLGLIPLLVAVHFYSINYVRHKAMRFANIEALEKIVQGGEVLPQNRLILLMRIITLAFFTLATTGALLHYDTESMAYDYVLAVDTSSSMRATDFSPDRISAVRDAAGVWLSDAVPYSSIGLVAFSTQARVLQPPTEDLSATKLAVLNLQAERTGGTALCEAIKASTNLLVESDRPKAVILVSDGQNNAGCPFDEGVAYAKSHNITLFTIGIGSESGGSQGDLSDLYFTLDSGSLRNASNQTGGFYQTAGDTLSLAGAFAGMNLYGPKKETLDLTVPFMLAAFALVFIDWSLSVTRYRAIP